MGPSLFKDNKTDQTVSVTTTPSLTNVFSTVSTASFSLSTSNTIASVGNKAAPINVVITASDPLPTNKSTTVQPILSVTIPPQHLKGNLPPKPQPHSYQIPLPATVGATISTPAILNQATPPVSTQNILSNVAPPVYSAIPEKSPVKSAGLGLQIEKSLSHSFTSNVPSEEKSDFDKSNTSVNSVEEVDPCPDFKPIIPLPEEVPINTGEENEKVLFCGRAKLFRYVNKEWRERGLGDIKILHNPESNKVRILMRRDQVHKICANHFITKDMTLSPLASSDKAFVWAANDYADEEVVLEKLCVKFKTPEEAKQFSDAFDSAIKLITETDIKKAETTTAESTKTLDIQVNRTTAAAPNATAVFGGFVFTSTPTFKPKDDKVEIKEIKTESTKASPFADFSFINSTSTPGLSPFTPIQKQITPSIVNSETSKVVPTSPTDDDHNATEFVPTAEFKPVIPLPAIVDVKSGEENAEVLHESRAKLLRFDGATKEWKERGLGNMKILKENKTIRLLMRREQVLKVCCNHQLLKSMSFTKMQNNPKALCWCAQDFSEEILKTETFALRFKTEEQADKFLIALHSAQASLDDNNVLQEQCVEKNQERNQHAKFKTDPEISPNVGVKQSSFGDRFKPKSGTWSCKTCYIVNEGKDNYCVACETPKHDNLPKKEISGASGPTFSFGIPSFTSSSTATAADTSFKFATKEIAEKAQPSGFGDLFKPKEGSWSCNVCYVRNDTDKLYCVSCANPKNDTVPKKEPGNTTTNTTVPSQSPFKFGISQNIQTTQPTGFGDLFKPKEGSWSCKTCYIRNDSDKLYCVSCEAPKDDTVPKKESNNGINLTTSASPFTFGIPPSTESSDTSTSTSSFSFGSKPAQLATGFVFGAASTFSKEGPLNLVSKPFTFTPPDQLTKDLDRNSENKSKDASTDKFIFGSPQKHTFEFTPRSPRRSSGCHGEEESDGSFVDEETDNIYFKPVIPLPDKVEVKTGEEEEEVLYCHRAKLFRFTEGEWKERGIGDVKILFHPKLNKLR